MLVATSIHISCFHGERAQAERTCYLKKGFGITLDLNQLVNISIEGSVRGSPRLFIWNQSTPERLFDQVGSPVRDTSLVERLDTEFFSDFSAESSKYRGLVLFCIDADFASEHSFCSTFRDVIDEISGFCVVCLTLKYNGKLL